MFCVCHTFLSVHCSLSVTCWERANLLSFLYVMFYCVIFTFICDVLGLEWYLIVSIPDLCLLPYYELIQSKVTHPLSETIACNKHKTRHLPPMSLLVWQSSRCELESWLSYLIVFMMSYVSSKYSLSLSRNSMVWSALCDCGMYRTYSHLKYI